MARIFPFVEVPVREPDDFRVVKLTNSTCLIALDKVLWCLALQCANDIKAKRCADLSRRICHAAIEVGSLVEDKHRVKGDRSW